MIKKSIFFVIFISIFLTSCSDGTNPNDSTAGTTCTTCTPSALGITGTTGTTGTTATSGAAAPANIALTATPSSIATVATSSIQATVTTSGGNNVADGTTVTYSVSSSAYGEVTSSSTTASGVATATFAALSVPGSVTITATSGSVSKTVAITITASENANIIFSSASPQVIGIKGRGQTELSTLIFAVKDVNGQPALDGTTVSFTMIGPGGGRLPSNGGEYIGVTDLTPTTSSSSTVGGNATVSLHSGSVAGPVSIKASVTTSSGTIATSSAVVSIGGGVPSATHFDLSTTKFNLPGLVKSGSEATIMALVADRFGNYNVLTGTSVSFYTEAGAIDRSNVTNASGAASVTFRTQAPPPTNVSIAAWETTSINSLNITYAPSPLIPTDGTYHPRDGWVTVLATVQGEEAFDDANANGIYDTGESFTDLGEPFIDKDDDGARDASSPFEEFIDVDGDGSYDGANGVWDGPDCTGTGCLNSKMIWKSITLVFTGNSYYCVINPTTIPVFANGSGTSFRVMIGDINTNRLAPGTTIAVAASVGTLTGQTSQTVPDGVSTGPSELAFSLSDSDATDTSVFSSTITVSVTSSDVSGCSVTASGSGLGN